MSVPRLFLDTNVLLYHGAGREVAPVTGHFAARRLRLRRISYSVRSR
jgi:hypothetical protein